MSDDYESRCGHTFEDEDTMLDHQDNCAHCEHVDLRDRQAAAPNDVAGVSRSTGRQAS